MYTNELPPSHHPFNESEHFKKLKKRSEFENVAMKGSKSRRKDEDRDDRKTAGKSLSNSVPPLHYYEDKPWEGLT